RRDDEVILTTPGRVIFNEEVMRSLQDALGDRFEGKADFINRTLGKKEMNDVVSSLVDVYGVSSIAVVLDTIKELGFHYATQAGITISKNDIVIPESKEQILEEYEGRVGALEAQYERGLITEEERKDSIVNVWTEATDTVAEAMVDSLYKTNPKGDIIERPIKANFMEGLSVLEYFISTHGARKGLADTALRTADSGYL